MNGLADEKKDEKVEEEIYSTSGLQENTAAVISYFGLFFLSVFFVFNEKHSNFVRFHAMQSTILFLSLLVIVIIFRYIPFGWIVNIVIGIIAILLWIMLMVKAYRKEYYKLPIIGDFAEKLHNRTKV